MAIYGFDAAKKTTSIGKSGGTDVKSLIENSKIFKRPGVWAALGKNVFKESLTSSVLKPQR